MTSRATQQFLKGQPIIQEGAPGDRTYRLISGEALVCKRNDDNELIPIATLKPGDLFGEMYLFEPDRARSATVVAMSNDVSVEIYFQDEMQKLLKTLHPSSYDLLQSFNQRLKRTSEHCAALKQGQNADGVKKLPNGTLKITGTVIQP